jgi:lysophospholipase
MSEYISTFDGLELYFHKEVDASAKAVCVIVHGLCEHQGRYDYLAEKFHEAGIGTYRFDHRGHGKSEGEEAHYDDYTQILKDVNVVVDKAIEENPDRKVFLLGHSMGGYAVALYGAMYPGKRLSGIVSSGALVRDNRGLIRGVPSGLDPHTRLPNKLGDGVCSVKSVVDWYGKDPLNRKSFTAGLCYSILSGIDWFSTHSKQFAYPVLMLHGQNDGLVSYKDTLEFFDMVSSVDKQYKIYGGLYHEIFNEYCRDETISDAIHWIENRWA